VGGKYIIADSAFAAHWAAPQLFHSDAPMLPRFLRLNARCTAEGAHARESKGSSVCLPHQGAQSSRPMVTCPNLGQEVSKTP
jgi:hypothetical protein